MFFWVENWPILTAPLIGKFHDFFKPSLTHYISLFIEEFMFWLYVSMTLWYRWFKINKLRSKLSSFEAFQPHLFLCVLSLCCCILCRLGKALRRLIWDFYKKRIIDAICHSWSICSTSLLYIFLHKHFRARLSHRYCQAQPRFIVRQAEMVVCSLLMQKILIQAA